MPRKQKAILAAIGLAVIAMLWVFSEEPSRPSEKVDCPAKGIDPEQLKEGTCQDGETEDVVVDRGHQLQLETLDARLEGERESAVLHGPDGTVRAPGRFVTFVLAITNRTEGLQSVGLGQVELHLGRFHIEDLAVEKADEPHSFVARERVIPPGATLRGTVTFSIPPKGVEIMRKEGNLDLDNFGLPESVYEPEAFYEQPQMGVIRTYH